MDARPGEFDGSDPLPAATTPFVGRRAELAALAVAASRPAKGRGRVLVVAGRPGSGRTTLAVRYARTVAADYPDGLLYARLSAPDGSRLGPGRAARQLLAQLGEPEAGLLPAGAEDPACEALREALAVRRALVLLDDVRDAGQLVPLLAVKTESLVIATTAGPLTGIEDIDPVILGGLEQPSAVELLGDLVGGTRISCDPVGAADLAEACAARPAALRLMAGWLRADPRAAVTDAAQALAPAADTAAPASPKARGATRPKAGRADGTGLRPAVEAASEGGGGGSGAGEAGRRAAGGRPGGVGGGPQSSDARPVADPLDNGASRPRDARVPADGRAGEPVPVVDGDPLVGAFALVYRKLPAARARLLRMLTLAPGQLADLRTASALVGCPAPEAAEALEKLAEQELLEREPAAADGTARYRVPGRLYGRLVELRERQDRPSEVELARARLLERLVRLVDSARLLLDPAQGPNPDPLPGPLRLRTAAQAGNWLVGEREQLLGAVEQAIGQGDLDGTAGRLVTALLRALPLTGEAAPADRYRLHESVLKVAQRQGAPRRAAAALLNLADLHAAAGQWEPAAERYHRSLEQARGAGDESGCARALEGVGNCRRALGDPVRAADWYGRALALRQALGDQGAEARLLVRIAEAHTAQRRFEEAVREYRAAVAVLRRSGDHPAEAAVASALERLQVRLGEEGGHPVSE